MAAANVVARYQDLRSLPRFPVSRYGARADGVSDDSPAITAAIAAATAAVNATSGALVELSAGAHLLGSVVQLKSNVSVIGHSDGTTVMLGGDPTAAGQSTGYIFQALGTINRQANDLACSGTTTITSASSDFTGFAGKWMTLRYRLTFAGSANPSSGTLVNSMQWYYIESVTNATTIVLDRVPGNFTGVEFTVFTPVSDVEVSNITIYGLNWNGKLTPGLSSYAGINSTYAMNLSYHDIEIQGGHAVLAYRVAKDISVDRVRSYQTNQSVVSVLAECSNINISNVDYYGDETVWNALPANPLANYSGGSFSPEVFDFSNNENINVQNIYAWTNSLHVNQEAFDCGSVISANFSNIIVQGFYNIFHFKQEPHLQDVAHANNSVYQYPQVRDIHVANVHASGFGSGFLKCDTFSNPNSITGFPAGSKFGDFSFVNCEGKSTLPNANAANIGSANSPIVTDVCFLNCHFETPASGIVAPYCDRLSIIGGEIRVNPPTGSTTSTFCVKMLPGAGVSKSPIIQNVRLYNGASNATTTDSTSGDAAVFLSAVSHPIIVGCIVEGSRRDGFYIKNCYCPTISRNIIESSGLNGIEVEFSSATYLDTNNRLNAEMSDNLIQDWGTGFSSRSGVFVNLTNGITASTNVRGLRITGNRIALSSVALNSHTGITVTNSISSGSLGDYIYTGNSITSVIPTASRYVISTPTIATDGSFTPQNRGKSTRNVADVDVTLVLSEWDGDYIEVTGALTATRNLTLPHFAGKVWCIGNRTTGGNAIQIIGATGTGVTIAATKNAIVTSDGTNFIRLSPDS